ncbi:MAG: hypothetical protein K8T91_28395 [Planctomycetes bacterium]|nr:hypothetical protein [Planctomycetota bacterium]
MQNAKQISVPLVNKPGKLAQLLTALAKEKVHLTALSVMDSKERSTLRFVPEDFDVSRRALEAMNIRFEVTEILLIDVPNQSGALRHVCEKLAAEHLNIDYVYGSCASSGSKKGAQAVLKVNDLAKAQRVLGEASVNGRVQPKPVRRRPTVRRR